MTNSQSTAPTDRKRLRLWPAVAIAIVQWLIALGVPTVAPEAEVLGFPLGVLALLTSVVLGLVIVFAWWLFFSRARWSERIGAIVLMIGAVMATRLLIHESIAGAGQGMLIYIATIPYLSLALVVWALIADRLSSGARRAALAAAILLACAPWTMLRTAGVTSRGMEWHWRWTETPEQRLLAHARDETMAPAPPPAVETPKEPVVTKPAEAPVDTARDKAAATTAPAAKPVAAPPSPDRKPAEWPGFRGPERDGIVHGVRIKTDWSASPPIQIWRRPIGPGWSSFAVDGDLLYTQEQRGDREMVSCYRVSTGAPVWRHTDAVRFWESNGGAGPRGTPALSNGRVYAFGATGILNALDARTGAVTWSRNVASDTGRAVPYWGFSSSPLIVDDIVIVAASGTLAGYDIESGNKRWVGPSRGGSYSSPHLATIGGVTQVVLLSPPGAIGVKPSDGTLLWEHKYEGGAIVQPALTPGGDVLINAIATTGGVSMRRIAVTQKAGRWGAEERWTSTGLKPYFNDFVVHNGHAFGFDGSILAAINLDDGTRKWKGGRYGNGQLLLLADQDVLLVLSEDGELALVSATPEQYKELARVPAIEGKTWNHPVLVRDVLLVRNGEEMAAFKVALER